MTSRREGSRPPRIALACGAAVCVLVAASAPSAARANDLADELTLGELKSAQSSALYWTDRLSGSGDVSDQVSLDANAALTHYAQSKQSKPGDILQFGLGGSWQPNDHWVFDTSLFVSPQSVSVEKGVPILDPKTKAAETVTDRDRTSAEGFSLGAEYDTATYGDADSAIDLSVSPIAYSTTQRDRTKGSTRFGSPTRGSLVQWQLLGTFTETLYDDTDLSASFGYYLYDKAPDAYYGAYVIGRASGGDGIPLLPLRYTIRPIVAHRFGSLQLRGYVEYGHYVTAGEWTELAGLKAQYKFSRAFRAWLITGVQRNRLRADDAVVRSPDVMATSTHAENLWNLWAGAGARLIF